MVPTDTGFVTIRPQLEAVDTANESDLESVLTTAEWAKLEDMSNLHEFSHATWTDELFQTQISNKRIGEGPPTNSVAARTFLDLATGHGTHCEYRRRGVVSRDIRTGGTKSRAEHYYDPATWRPRGNWANGRVNWTRKTTRPFEIWPELRTGTGPVAQQLAIVEWRQEVKR
jgi:hypothetical protein